MRLPAKLHYAWVVAAVTFVVLLLTAGVRAAPGILIVPLENEFHWARSTISFAVGVNLLLYGLIGPFAAALIDRFGVRRTMAVALAVTAAGVALTPAMRQSWQLILLWGVVVGASCGVIGNFLAAFIAARWFRVHQGLVVGVLTAANAAGQLIFLPTMAGLATSAGWRVMSLLLAASVAAFVPLIALLMRDRPEDLGLAPYGASHAFRPAPALDGNPLTLAFRAFGESARSRDFWLIAGSYFVCGASTNGLIGTHLIPACLDHGIPQVTSATLLAAMGVFDLVGTTLSGWLSDRWSNRGLLAWYYGLRGLSLIYLPFAFDLSFYGLSLFAVFYGLDWIATVPPTPAMSDHRSKTWACGYFKDWPIRFTEPLPPNSIGAGRLWWTSRFGVFNSRLAHHSRGARAACDFRVRARCGLGSHLDLYGHTERIRRKAGPGAGDRHRLPRIAGHGHADQIVVADDAVRRVELDPAGSRQINAQPGVSGAAADPPAFVNPAFVNIEIAGYEMRGEPEGAHSFHHQHGEIAAAAAAQPQGPDRVLDTAFLTFDICQVLPDRIGHRCKQFRRIGAAIMAQELPRPLVDFVLGIEILPFHGPQQIGHFVGAVGERVSSRIFLDLKVEDFGRGLLETNHALEAQLLSSPAEPGNRDAVAEHVVDPSDIHGFRRDHQLSLEQFLVVIVARPQHQPVLAECNGLLVAISGEVLNGKDGHGSAYCELAVCA